MKNKKNFPILFMLMTFAIQTAFSQTWQQIGPQGGFFKEFIIHPTNSSIVYAGSDDGGGVWKTTDGGASWNLLTANYPNMTGWSITLDENSPNTLYACDVYSRFGILKSTDGGSSWSEVTTGLSTAYDRMVSGLVIQSADTLLISTGEGANTDPPRPGNGVFISTNGGSSWTAAGLQEYTIPSIGRNVFGTVFAGSESNGLFVTNDNGATWTPHSDVPMTSTVNEIDVQDSVIVLGTSSGVFLSTNWGINFNNIGLIGDWNFDVAIHKLSPNIEIYSPSFTGLQHYSTGTSMWTVVSSPELSGQLVMGIASDGTNVYVGMISNNPLVKSTDAGSTWGYLSNGPVATELNDIYVDPLDNSRILTCLLGTYIIGGNYTKECIYETNDGGASWGRKGPAAHALCLTPNPLNSNSFYLGTFSQGLYKTDNSFSSFTQLISGNKLIGDVAVSVSDTNIVIVTEIDLDLSTIALKRSINGGNTFTTVATLLASRVLFNPDNNDTVYVATDNGIYRSVDYGVSWNAWQLLGEDILSLAYSGNMLLAGNNQGTLYKIVGSTVSDVSGAWQTPVEVKSIYSVNNELFVGLNGAEQDTINELQGSIWQSSDNAATWIDITYQMTSTNVYGNNIIASDGNELFAGTYGGGIFKLNGLVLGIEAPPVAQPFEIYPNPTNDYITVGFDRKPKTNYMVQLSTLDGKVLLSQKLRENNQVSLSGLPSGVYLLKMYDKSTVYSTMCIKY